MTLHEGRDRSGRMDKTDIFQISIRADGILLKLLDGIERDIADGKLPSTHLKAYEALCRAEASRSGR